MLKNVTACLTLLVLFILYSCSNSKSTEATAAHMDTTTIDPKAYEIGDSTVERMQKNYTDTAYCAGKCTEFQKLDRKKSRRDAIVAAPGIDPKDIKRIDFIRARYGPSDVERYRRLNNRPSQESVEGSTTEIMVITYKDKTKADPLAVIRRYFDSSAICPPPGDC